MKIVTPYARIVNPTPDSSIVGIRLLRQVEWFGRISHRSEDRQGDETWRRFIETAVVKHGDWSITEHVHISVDAVVDRGISHEWVRHRIGAYTQESTRFINYMKRHTSTDEYVNPAAFICPPAILNTRDTTRGWIYDRWVEGRVRDEEEYRAYIEAGIAPQEARTCFPNALATRLVATYNLRNWRHFFLMRTTREAHPQMREVTIPLLHEFKQLIPLLYDDIQPAAPQAENVNKAR